MSQISVITHRLTFLSAWLACAIASAKERPARPDPVTNPSSPHMLHLAGEIDEPDEINFAELPRVPAVHAMISDVRDRGGKWVHQHAYLAHYDGLYWAMWSDGPGLPHANVSPEKHRNLVPGHDISSIWSEDGTSTIPT